MAAFWGRGAEGSAAALQVPYAHCERRRDQLRTGQTPISNAKRVKGPDIPMTVPQGPPCKGMQNAKGAHAQSEIEAKA